MISRRKKLFPVLLATLTGLILLGLSGCGVRGPVAVTLDNNIAALQLQGKVHMVSAQDNLLTIKPPSLPEISFKLTESTVYQDAESIKSIKKGMGVVVIYQSEATGNQALIVRKLPEGSCN